MIQCLFAIVGGSLLGALIGESVNKLLDMQEEETREKKFKVALKYNSNLDYGFHAFGRNSHSVNCSCGKVFWTFSAHSGKVITQGRGIPR